MKERIQFRNQMNEILEKINPQVLSHNEDEFWMIQSTYEYMEYYALENRLENTYIALHLARGLHNGTYRKSTVYKKGMPHHLPYMIHCLMVCRMLADLTVPLPKDEEDILLASALCHDMLEDIPFQDHGIELTRDYFLDSRVYETVKLVTKRPDFSEDEEKTFFHNIESNPLALLIKLSDRCHNVEDLYNRSLWKVHEYIGETRKYFLPMCQYGIDHYSELTTTIQILQEKMINLTVAAEILVERYEERERELKEELRQVKEENKRLRETWIKLWNE